ncbi:MAG TPA: DUF5915 domain-containing protein, partial [Methanoregulaceae archaeon]|nr:DUF5915 domain-containing protein [Methanoregulaceae archaeon]
GETVRLDDGEESYEISASQVAFSEALPETVFSAPMNGGTVYVDVTLTPGLESEGYAREVIRRIQEMRRQLDLNVEDYIRADACISDGRVSALVGEMWRDGIREEVRAKSLTIRSPGVDSPEKEWDLSTEWEIEGIPVTISISKIEDS